jgi:hypothetical protein
VRAPIWLSAGLLPATALALAGGAVDSHPPAAAALVSSTGGAAAVSDSLGGDAILHADDLGPGRSTAGTVTIANSGDAAGAFTLAESALADAPGSGGGRLSTRLELNVEEVGSGRRVYAGGLADMSEQPLGYLLPGESRAYRFTVAFPDGAGDNAYAGARTAVSFDWTAATGEPPVDPPSATPPPGSTGSTVPEPPPTAARPPVDSTAPRIRITSVPQRWTTRAVPITITCDERCFLVGMSRGAKAKPRQRLLAGVPTRQEVRLSHDDARTLYRRVRLRGHGTVSLALTVKDRAGNLRTAGFSIRAER